MGGMVMTCLKCGREISDDQVFCDACLKTMQKYPVPHDIVVQLPRRKMNSVRKVSKKRAVPLEDQVKILHKNLRVLSVALIVASVLIAILIPIAVSHLMEEHYELGQNYTAITPTTQPEESKDVLLP